MVAVLREGERGHLACPRCPVEGSRLRNRLEVPQPDCARLRAGGHDQPVGVHGGARERHIGMGNGDDGGCVEVKETEGAVQRAAQPVRASGVQRHGGDGGAVLGPAVHGEQGLFGVVRLRGSPELDHTVRVSRESLVTPQRQRADRSRVAAVFCHVRELADECARGHVGERQRAIGTAEQHGGGPAIRRAGDKLEGRDGGGGDRGCLWEPRDRRGGRGGVRADGGEHGAARQGRALLAPLAERFEGGGEQLDHLGRQRLRGGHGRGRHQGSLRLGALGGGLGLAPFHRPQPPVGLQSGACLVALGDEAGDHAAGRIMLVERVRQLLAGGVERLFERERLEHQRVPFRVQQRED
mmetsp:Transcript_13693/g.34880  ORF Transcript_13693/g.34880 Transcript_13693/m.34880 type:complete len:353 (-) Transcript_13693:273-1331(-)